MKIIAFYLPQFHAIKENDEWWGKGFTEWENIKSSKPLYKSHNMPRIPYNNNYYNLTDVKTLEWQANIAKKNGIYGFAYYHYWSEGKMLLEKPAEIMLKHSSVDIPFCFSWANHTWTRCWANKSDEVLWEQHYGNKDDWEKHFYYLLPFFRDPRYIRIDDKPLMILYNPIGVEEFPEMMREWKKLAIQNGLNGICFVNQENQFNHESEKKGKEFSYGIEFQMNRAVREYAKKSVLFQVERILNRIADKIPVFRCKCTTMHYSYDTIWKIILHEKPLGPTWFPGAFVDWDNTPRRKNRGQVCTDVSPEKFEYYLTQQIKRAREIYNKDYLFMFAWNEWGESGYLEPDEKNGYKMLEAVKKSLIANNEFEK